MDLHNVITDAAYAADIAGLSLTASKLYEALSALNTEEVTSTLVINISTGEEYYAKALDPADALRRAHADLCQCEEYTLIFTPHSIGLCSFYVRVEDTKRYVWEKACVWDRVDADSKFVAFAEDNPWTKILDTI